MKYESVYDEILASVRRRIQRLDHQVELAQKYSADGSMKESYTAAFDAEETAEKLTLKLRTAPAYTGFPEARDDMEKILENTVPVKMGYTREGWFCLKIPCLLPKKEKGSADYIRGFLNPAMDRFFSYGYPKKVTDCVLIYRHVYDRTIPERRWRDHDNIEINFVSDKVAQYVMADDSPNFCRHYYCSAAGAASETQVYVVPFSDFGIWLSTEPMIPDSGLPLIEDPRYLDQKSIRFSGNFEPKNQI